MTRQQLESDISEGKKFDLDKPRYDLIPPEALHEIVNSLTYGAKKYDPENWKKVSNANQRYFAAAQRHIWAWKRGEEFDPESKIHHLACAAVNIMFILELQLSEDLTTNT